MMHNVLVIKTGEPLLSASSRLSRALYLSALTAEVLPTTFLTSSYDHHTEQSLSNLEINSSHKFKLRTVFQFPYLKKSYLSRVISSHLSVVSFLSWIYLNRSSVSLIICAFPTPELATAVAVLSRLLSIPLVLDVRDMWPDVIDSLLPLKRRRFAALFFIYYRLLRLLSVKLSTVILTGSTFYAKHLSPSANDKVLIFPVMNVSISSDIESTLSGPSSIASRNQDSYNGVIKIVFCGTLGNSNCLTEILEYFLSLGSSSANAPFHFSFYGDGEKYEYYRSFDSPFLKFNGWTSLTSSLLPQYDLALLPYPRTVWYEEFFGNKYFECLDAGIPVLLSHGRGLAYDVITRYGLGLSYNHSPSSLFEILASLQKDPTHLDLMRSNILNFYTLFRRYRRFKEYQFNSMLSRFVAFPHV